MIVVAINGWNSYFYEAVKFIAFSQTRTSLILEGDRVV